MRLMVSDCARPKALQSQLRIPRLTCESQNAGLWTNSSVRRAAKNYNVPAWRVEKNLSLKTCWMEGRSDKLVCLLNAPYIP